LFSGVFRSWKKLYIYFPGQLFAYYYMGVAGHGKSSAAPRSLIVDILIAPCAAARIVAAQHTISNNAPCAFSPPLERALRASSIQAAEKVK
jgi:hypothetical protein